MTKASEAAFVTLQGGLTLPLVVVQLALDLEQRGLRLRAEPDGDVLFCGPRERLTDDDRAALRRWKLHLLALLRHQVPDDQRPQ